MHASNYSAKVFNVMLDKYHHYIDKNKTIWTRGYIVHGKNIIKEENLPKYISKYRLKEFTDILGEISGSYSIIILCDNRLCIASDMIRSYPIYYHMKDHKVSISNSMLNIMEEHNLQKINDDSVFEFKAVGYVTGVNTLLDNVCQTCAGQMLTFTYQSGNLVLKKHNTFVYLSKNKNNLNKAALLEQLTSISRLSFERLIKYTKNRPIVVPLSGGYDSRYIVSMLKELGSNNVITYTYGAVGNNEAIVSRQVANKLGYKWIFIPYTEDMWDQFWSSKEYLSFIKFVGNYSSIAHSQDYLAVKYLKNNKMIPDNSIFVPGHTGDFLAGKHLSKAYGKYFKNEIGCGVSKILDSHYTLDNDWKRQNLLRLKYSSNIVSVIKSSGVGNDIYNYEAFEVWEWLERQSKFVANSVRLYEYFGYDWKMPLWENRELLNYFSALPVEYKIDNLYDHYLENILFHLYDINYPRVGANQRLIDKIKAKAINHLPPVITKILKKLVASDVGVDDLMRNRVMNSYLKNKGITINMTGRYNTREALQNLIELGVIQS